LAPAHYAKDALNFIKGNDINFVPKDMNPPNVPQCHPIERSWALVQAILDTSKKGDVAKNQKDFQRKWTEASQKVSDITIKRLMEIIRTKIGYEYQKP
jgi:hypothetical protein